MGWDETGIRQTSSATFLLGNPCFVIWVCIFIDALPRSAYTSSGDAEDLTSYRVSLTRWFPFTDKRLVPASTPPLAYFDFEQRL